MDRSARTPVNLVAYTVIAAFSVLTVVEWWPWVAAGGDGLVGTDFLLYRDAAARFLSGDSFYLQHQLAGPYVVTAGDVLYPPPALLLFIPFTLLPAVLWWAIPLAVVAWIVAWHRPSPVAWAGIALCVWFPTTILHTVHGNPFIWAVMAVALSTRWKWPGALVLLKPTLLPFALIDLRHRVWWKGLAGLAMISLVFLPMWPDYIAVLRNAQGTGGLGYSLQEFPAMAIPVFAWLGSTRRRDQAGTSS